LYELFKAEKGFVNYISISKEVDLVQFVMNRYLSEQLFKEKIKYNNKSFLFNVTNDT